MLVHIGGLSVDQLRGKKKTRNPYRPRACNSVRRPDLRIVDSMARRAGYWGKSYVFPTQKTLREWCLKDHGLTYSPRHLNRHLNALVVGCYIRRRTRTDKRTGKHTSTLYWILGRFFSNLRQATKALYNMARGPRDSRAFIRVPRAAQYLRNVFKSSHLSDGFTAQGPPKPA